MKQYTLKKVSGTPDWSAIEIAPIDTVQWLPDVGITAQAQLCWNDDAILVHLSAKEKEIRAENRGILDEVCEDSCLEFFIRPTEDLRYFNFEFNPNCALYSGFGSGVHDLTRLLVRDPAATFAPKANRTEDGWEIFYQIPFAFIHQFFPEFKAEVGTKFYGNMYKCGDMTPQCHYLAWNPIQLDFPRFHCPEYFGRLILGDA